MNLRTTYAAAMVVVACGLAAGQTADKAAQNDKAPQAMRGSFDRPLGAQPEDGGAAGDANVHYMASYTDGDDTYQLTIDGGKRSVTHNGEEVEDSKVRTRRGKLQVLGDDGRVVCEFDLPGRNSGTRGQRWGGNGGFVPLTPRVAPAIPWTPRPPEVPLAMGEQPRVMLGVYMSSEEDGRVRVSKVIPGLAAEKAGVQEGDVLVSLDGHEIEDASSIRGILKDHKPGDAVDLVVRRDDKDTTLKVDLQAYEQHKLSEAAPGENNIEVWTGQGENDWSAQAQKSIEKAIEALKASPELKDAREQVSAALQSALEAVKSAKEDGLGALQRMGPALTQRLEGLRELQELRGLGGNGRSFVFSAPAAPEANSDELKAVQEKLDALQRKLDAMSEKLDKISRSQ